MTAGNCFGLIWMPHAPPKTFMHPLLGYWRRFDEIANSGYHKLLHETVFDPEECISWSEAEHLLYVWAWLLWPGGVGQTGADSHLDEIGRMGLQCVRVASVNEAVHVSHTRDEA